MIYRIEETKKQGRLATFRTRERLRSEFFDADRPNKFPAGKKIQRRRLPQIPQRRNAE
jgi:hypothetical protein